MDPKLNPATAEIQALRNQVADRDKQILSLEVNLHFNLVQTEVMFTTFFPKLSQFAEKKQVYQNIQISTTV